MTTKTEEARGLLAIALDPKRGGGERLAAWLQADGIRKDLKVGWGKLTEDGAAINAQATLAELQDAAEAEAHKKPAKPKPAPAAAPKAPAPKADKPKPAAKPKDEARGRISALVRRLLEESDLPYAKIVEAVLKEHPEAKTTARSVASVAADMRSAGKKVAMRRQEAAAS